MSAALQACSAAKAAARVVGSMTTAAKDAGLEAMAAGLEAAVDDIVAANAQDLDAARASGVAEAVLDRLALSPPRVTAMVGALRALRALPDPVGVVVRGFTLPNGLQVRQVRVPLGVLAMVYEGRPNVTVDAAGLALRSGNTCVLRGSSTARHTNAALVGLIRVALSNADLPADAVCLVGDTSRESVKDLCHARGLVDLLVPRGGAELIASVAAEARVPVIETGVGNCHVYVDAGADFGKAAAIVVNAKTQRPGVCNAAETLLVHADVAEVFLPRVAARLREAGVELVGDGPAQELAGAEPATARDWDTEYLDLRLAVRVVDDLRAAIGHIAAHGTGHSEAIVTEDRGAARRFVAEVDAAAVMVNASTRFTDGSELGFGAELGISTQKLHARGPLGLTELTTTKWVIEGDGQVRG
ncbi:MAG: glutamate-5-semialdehyde dehydrogenase [Euzebyales bacterium]|nr:glutamate-5-semialdehyde dehydrogenase [Euzebyales bacterium]